MLCRSSAVCQPALYSRLPSTLTASLAISNSRMSLERLQHLLFLTDNPDQVLHGVLQLVLHGIRDFPDHCVQRAAAHASPPMQASQIRSRPASFLWRISLRTLRHAGRTPAGRKANFRPSDWRRANLPRILPRQTAPARPTFANRHPRAPRPSCSVSSGPTSIASCVMSISASCLNW